MPIRHTIPCPSCQRVLDLPEAVLNRLVQCPLCQVTFRVRQRGQQWIGEMTATPPAALPVESGAEAEPATAPEPTPAPAERPRSRPRDSELEPLPLPATPRQSTASLNGPALFRFEVRIEHDPEERLEGDFHAEIDAQGLHLWRGQGRLLHSRRGDGAKYVGRDRLRIFLEGRWVLLRVRTRRAAVFTRALVDYLNGQTETLAPPGREFPLSLLLVLPLLVLGLVGLWWGWWAMLLATPLIGLLLGLTAGVLFLLPQQREVRLVYAVLLNLLLGAAIVLLVRLWPGSDQAATPPHLWGIVPRHDQGFLVEMPGVAQTRDDLALEGFALPRAGCFFSSSHTRRFEVFYGEFDPPLDGPGQPIRQAKIAQIEHALRQRFGRLDCLDVQVGNPIERRLYVAMSRNEKTEVLVALVPRRGVILAARGPRNPDFDRFFHSLQLLGDDWRRPLPADPKMPAPKGDTRSLPPEARLLAAADDGYLWAAYQSPGHIVAWHAQRGLVEQEHGRWRTLDQASSGFTEVAAVPGGPVVVARAGPDASLQRLVQVPWPLFQLTETALLRPGTLCLSADGQKLAIGLDKGRVQVWDVSKQCRVAQFDLSPAQVVRLAFSPRGDTLAVALGDGSVTLLPTRATGRPSVTTQTRHDKPPADVAPALQEQGLGVRGLSFAPDGARLLSIGNDLTARLHHARNGRLLFSLALPSAPTAVAFFPSGRLFAVATADGVIRLYDTLAGKPRATLRDRPEFFPQAEIVRHLAFSPNGEMLLAVTPRGIEQWDILRTVRPVEKERQALPFNLLDGYLPGRVQRMAGARDHLVADLKDQGIHIFKTPELEMVGEPLRLPPQQPADLLVSADGRRCLVRTGLQMQMLDLASQRVVASTANVDFSGVMAVSADGRMVVSLHGGRLRLWQPDEPAAALRLVGCEPQKVQALALHPSGERLAAAISNSAEITWLDLPTGSTLARLRGHAAPATHLAISPDGKTLASFAADRTLLLWDTAQLRCRARLGIPTVALVPSQTTLQFSADSRTLILAQSDFSVVVDVASGRCLNALPTPQCLGVALDGDRRLYLAMNDRPLRVVNLHKPPYSERPTAQPEVALAWPVPEIADLVPQTTEPHLALVGDRDKQTALALTRDRLLLRLELSTLQLRDVFWTGQILYQAALDPARGQLFAASVDLQQHDRLDSPEKAQGPILVYDVRDLLAGRACPPVLKPRGSLPLSGHFDALLVAAEVAILRERQGDQAILHVVDLAKLRVQEPLQLPLNPSGPLALSADGQTLVVSGSQAGKSGGALVRVKLANRQVGAVVELPRPIRELALTPDWLLVRTQFDPIRGSTVFLDEQDRELARWKDDQPSTELLLAGTRLFSLFDRGRFSPRELPLPKQPPPTRPAEPARPLQALFNDPPYVGPVRVLAGQWLVSPSGHAYRLREAGLLPTPEKSCLPATPLKQLASSSSAQRLRVHLLHPLDREQLQVGLSNGVLIEEKQLAQGQGMFRRHEDGLLAYTTQEKMPILLRDRQMQGMPERLPAPVRLLGGDRVVLWGQEHLVYPSTKGLALVPLRTTVRLTAKLFPVAEPISTLDALPRGRLVCGDIIGQLHVFDPVQGRLHTFSAHEGEVRVVRLAAAGRLAYSAGVDGKIYCWETGTGKRMQSLEGHAHVVSALALSSEGKWLASGALDGSVLLWDLTTGRQHCKLTGRPNEPIGGLLLRNNELIVAAGPHLRRYALPR